MLDKNALDLIIRMVSINPNDRLSMEEIKSHAYFSSEEMIVENTKIIVHF